uniref:RING-type domain-containing protein n=1 Tax=Trichuris muris TaxID=70415 RepID=A0A5S6QNP5_TRIMR
MISAGNSINLSSLNPAAKPGSDVRQGSSQMGNKSTYDARETNVINGHQFAQADGPDQPLSFHRVHGSNIRLYSNGSIARREQSFCKALSFSNRPIRRNEKFGFRIIECDDEWSGALRIGITNLNPLDIRDDLPKYACPDLTNTQRSWAKGVGERYCKKGNYFTFSVSASGEMIFAVNGLPRGMFLAGINARETMWAVVDVYGNCRAVEFLKGGLAVDTFHATTGDNIWLSEDRTMAAQVRAGDAAKNSCVVLSHPLRPSSVLPMRVIKLNGAHGSLTAGVILCHPDTVRKSWVQSGAAILANQGEGYIFKKDVIGKLRLFDDIAFIVDEKNVLYVLVGGSRLRMACTIQGGVECYLFFELCGSVSGLQICSESDVSVAGLQQRSLAGDISGRASPRVASTEVRAPPIGSQPLRVVIPPMDRRDRESFGASAALPGMAKADSFLNTSEQSTCLTSTSSSPSLSQCMAASDLNSEAWIATRSSRDQLQDKPIVRPCSSSARTATASGHPIRVSLPPVRNDVANDLVEATAARVGERSYSSRPSGSLRSLPTISADVSRRDSNVIDAHGSNSGPLPPVGSGGCAVFDQGRGEDRGTGEARRTPPAQAVLSFIGKLLTPAKVAVPSGEHPSDANLTGDVPSASAEWFDDQEEQDECKICMVARIDSAFYPCGHYSMCYPCAKLTFKKQGVCPICRKSIRDVLKIFKS